MSDDIVPSLKAQDGIVRFLSDLQFEINDTTLRSNVRKAIQELLSDEGEFRVVCDESNNPPDAIDRGEMNVSVFIPSGSLVAMYRYARTLDE